MEKVLLFNKGVMFVLELTTMGSFAYWGFHNQTSRIFCFLFGIGIPVMVAIIWSFFASPGAVNRLSMPYRGIFTIILFWTSGALLYLSGAKEYAVVFIILSLIAVTLATVLET
jgi:hypothetical protein